MSVKIKRTAQIIHLTSYPKRVSFSNWLWEIDIGKTFLCYPPSAEKPTGVVYTAYTLASVASLLQYQVLYKTKAKAVLLRSIYIDYPKETRDYVDSLEFSRVHYLYEVMDD